MATHPTRRSKLLIYPRIQLQLMGLTLMITLFCFLTVEALLQQAFGQLKSIGMSLQLPPQHPFFQFLDYQLSTLHLYLSLALLICGAAAAILTLFTSHRMVGPIVRLKSYFEELTKNPEARSPLSFRKKDYFSDLPPAINSALERIQNKP